MIVRRGEMPRSSLFTGRWPALALATGLAVASIACCPSVAGPTAPAASYSGTLAPGEFSFYDAETPAATTQINLDFTLNSATIPLRLRQIDPSCVPTTDDNCQNFYDATTPPRPAGVLRFGNTLQPHGSRTRVVLQNQSLTETMTYSVTIAPHRAGCT
jgi:hypothetical protein